MLGWGLITTLLLIALAIFTVRLFPPAPPKEAGSFVMIDMEPASKSTSYSKPSGTNFEILFFISVNVNLNFSLPAHAIHPVMTGDSLGECYRDWIREDTSSSVSCLYPTSGVITARSMPFPLAASLWAEASSALAATLSASFSDMLGLN